MDGDFDCLGLVKKASAVSSKLHVSSAPELIAQTKGRPQDAFRDDRQWQVYFVLAIELVDESDGSVTMYQTVCQRHPQALRHG
uniref:Uncharacterized protein n=1 Tax=Peronospora matthiolae TaxID=2874970 RepID=A0AAV1VAC8_9STRA